MENIEKEWIDYVKNWNNGHFETYECLGCGNHEPIEEMKDYIVRCIKSEFDETVFENYIIPKHTYSSKGMTQIEEILFLIRETEKKLFEGHTFMTSIIFDGYNIKYGLQGVREIIGCFINWVDTDKEGKS